MYEVNICLNMYGCLSLFYINEENCFHEDIYEEYV